MFKPFGDDKQLDTLIDIITGCKHRRGKLEYRPDASLVWALITHPKNDLDGDIAHYAHQAGETFKWLDRGWLYRDSIATNTLREYAVWCLAIGMMQGLTVGRTLDAKVGGGIALLLKHASVRKLLVKEPKATNLAICKALDKVERMPWPKLNKHHGTWEKAAGEQSVRTLISQSRRAAQASTNYEHLLLGLQKVNNVTGLVKAR